MNRCLPKVIDRAARVDFISKTNVVFGTVLTYTSRVASGLRNGKLIIDELYSLRVIPYQLSKNLHLIPSELDETWYVGSVCGFMKPPKTTTSYAVWLRGYGSLNIQNFFF